MKIVDPHHHLWNLDELCYPWLDVDDGRAFFGSYRPIQRNYLITDYLSDTDAFDIVASVHVQAEHDDADPVAETAWLQAVADSPESRGFPQAIVAFADLTRPDVGDVIAAHREYSNLRGIRQIVNYHENPDYSYTDRNLLEDDGWWSRFALLQKYDLSFDLQLYFHQMRRAARLATDYANVPVVLNHTGMPLERDEESLAGWRDGMKRLAACDNVAVKISGLGMCDPRWSVESIRPYVLHTIDTFGPARCMFASNFPVDSLFGNYESLFQAYTEITHDFSADERQLMFHDNALAYYRIRPEPSSDPAQ